MVVMEFWIYALLVIVAFISGVFVCFGFAMYRDSKKEHEEKLSNHKGVV